MLCTFTKKDGSKCTANAIQNSQFCVFHDPNIPDSERFSIRSKGGSNSHSLLALGEEGWRGEVLPEMKMEKLRDVANVLADSINQVRAGKISPKTGGTLAYMSFVLYMIMDKAKAEEKEENIAKLKAEGKYIPEPEYVPKTYSYKDEYYLDKDSNPLIVEHNKINYGQNFKNEKRKKHRRKVILKHTANNGDSEKDFAERTSQLVNNFEAGVDSS
jgi:hypothetical protein